MRRPARIAGALLGLAGWLAAATAGAQQDCRIAFDMGSSGIRAGASGSATVTRAQIDFFGPASAGRLEDTAPAAIAALQALPRQSGFAPQCARVGGGFSVWRMALAQDRNRLATTLARIHAESGVAVIVLPQHAEGAYGYTGARQALGPGLQTSHVLDIGGGSLQIGGADSAWGEALGQKSWHGLLCRALRDTDANPCPLAPMNGTELARARQLLAQQLQGVGAALPGPVTLTAISRPVTRGIAPALQTLWALSGPPAQLQPSQVSAAIAQLAQQPPAGPGCSARPPTQPPYLLSDLLLVEGLLQATGNAPLQIADVDLTNLPGLLADDRAFAWGRRYGCYLDRLRQQGLPAYDSDPATCPAPPHTH